MGRTSKLKVEPSIRPIKPKQMSKPKKTKTVSLKRNRDPEREAAIRRVCIHLFFVFVFAGAIAAAGYFSRNYVAKKVAFPSDPPQVVLMNRPAWMSDLLAEEIVRQAKPAGAHSAFDHQMLVDIDRILRASPWIKEVRQIRRTYQDRPGDTIEIDCDYRAPVALVQSGPAFWLVDGDGVKLPSMFNSSQLERVVRGADKKINIRIVTGVNHAPVGAGKKWPGDDLQAGLDMVKLLYGLPYAEEIVTVDVSNIGGRVKAKEPQITLGTTHEVLVDGELKQTYIKWGRPINGGNDFFVEIPTARKLEVLKAIREQKGRVDANEPWIDIRFDSPTFPSVASGSGQ
jgi:hypothetical protein